MPATYPGSDLGPILWLRTQDSQWRVVGHHGVLDISKSESSRDPDPRNVWFLIWETDGSGGYQVRERLHGSSIHSYGFLDPADVTYYSSEATLSGNVDLDVNATLEKNATRAFLSNDGAANMGVALSRNGSDYGTTFTMYPGERLTLDRQDIDTIRLIHSGADTYYRVFAE